MSANPPKGALAKARPEVGDYTYTRIMISKHEYPEVNAKNKYPFTDCVSVSRDCIVRKSLAGDFGYISNSDFRDRELGHPRDSR